ncbi:MAG: cytochrome c5 family protein [Saprospiraceae bacterium]|nr:cytochrome c5 family protein [Saprospiraceae bacterium]
MKKIIFYALMLSVFAFAISACGGKKEAPANEVKTETTTTPAETATAAVDYTKWTPNFENGKKIYAKTCMTCHFAGVTGAPALQPEKYKLEDWQKRADMGINVLMTHAINGYTNPVTKNLMPVKGTCVTCTEQDLFDAINYMYREAKAVFKN